MTAFKQPEKATVFGAIAAGAIEDGFPAGAVWRELLRNSNLLHSRGGLIAYAHGAAVSDNGDAVNPGSILPGIPPVVWIPLLSTPILPGPKRSDIVTARVAIDFECSSGQAVELFVSTTLDNNPRTDAPDRYARIVGTGAADSVTLTGVEVRAQPGEFVNLWARHIVDTAKDSLMATGTYGTPNTSTTGVLRNGVLFDDATVTWTDPLAGGHYVHFTDTTNFTHQDALVLGVSLDSTASEGELELLPRYRGPMTSDVSYEIRESPRFQLYSFAVYGEDS